MQPLASSAAIGGRHNVHIDGCEGSVGDGAADGTSESESRVQGKASGRGRVGGRKLSLCGINLAGARGGGRGRGGHFAGMDGRSEGSGVERFGGVEDGQTEIRKPR
jgi:hypothetical protein